MPDATMITVDSERYVLAGRYRLGSVIGRGGMGTVYRATDLILGRAVAVKVLPGLLAEQDPVRVTRFEREARIAARLIHPAVVSVYDTGVDRECRFIVMEYLDGCSLAALVYGEAPLGPVRAVRIASAVAGGLAAAHGAGVVHRDVKPANVMVSTEGLVKILDFGLARLLDQSALTQSAMAAGTASYMAPEQALGERVDARSDVYSLGCLLYAMLTGRPPFTADSAAAIIHQQIHREPVPPSAMNRRVSRSLDALVGEMLAKSPDARPQNAEAVRVRLELEDASRPRRSVTSAGARRRASKVTAQADRTAGQTDRTAAQTDRTAAQADRTAAQTDRTGGQADRTATQADRMAREADRTAGQAGSAPTQVLKGAATRAIAAAKAKPGRGTLAVQLMAVAGLIALVALYSLGSDHSTQHKRSGLGQSTSAKLSRRSRVSPSSSSAPARRVPPALPTAGSARPSTPPPSLPEKAPSRGPGAGDEGEEGPEPPVAGGEPPGQAKKHRAAGPPAAHGEAPGAGDEPPGRAKKHGADGEGGD